jgi:hypothetical protein
MGYERTGIAVIPQSAWEPLTFGDVAPIKRCRDCEGYADPTATHADCIILHTRKAGYAGACKKRVQRGHAIPAEGQRLCIGCGADISHRKSTAKYCVDCRERVDSQGHAHVSKRPAPNTERTCLTCGADISHRRSHAAYCEPCRAQRTHRSNASITTRTETSMPEFTCTECDRAFTSSQGLALHKTRTHSVTAGRTATTAPVAPAKAPGWFDDMPTIEQMVEEVAVLDEVITTAQMIADMSAETVEIRVQFIEYVLGRFLAAEDVADVMRDHVYPIIEAAERHGEAVGAL